LAVEEATLEISSLLSTGKPGFLAPEGRTAGPIFREFGTEEWTKLLRAVEALRDFHKNVTFDVYWPINYRLISQNPAIPSILAIVRLLIFFKMLLLFSVCFSISLWLFRTMF